MKKRGSQQMMWIIISAILAILVLAVYSYMTGGIIKKATNVIFNIQDSSDEQARCSVFPGTAGDANGDGIRDDLPECQKYAT